MVKKEQKQEWDANTLCIIISIHPSLHALCMTVGRVMSDNREYTEC